MLMSNPIEVEKEKLLSSIFAGWKPAPNNATFGLNPGKVNPRVPSVDEILKYLSTLNFKLGNQDQVYNKWECFERALWGIVHARHRYPGIAIGIAEGKSRVGPREGHDHAVIIVWERGFSGYRYFEPLNREAYSCDLDPMEITRIIAFPFGTGDPTENVWPIKNLNMPRIKYDNYISTKNKYYLYPRGELLDYLNKQTYEFKCTDLQGHQWVSVESFREYWRNEDWAFWSYIHVRHDFEGCAIGVAYGDPASGKSTMVNVIWHKEGNEYRRLYWDPSPEMRRDVTNGFKPRILLF